MASVRPERPELTASSSAPSHPIAVELETLLGNTQELKRLLWLCLRHLGVGATAKDAEDALQECLRLVIRNHVGSKGPVRNYLVTIIRRYSWRMGRIIRKRAELVGPLQRIGPDGVVDIDPPDLRPISDVQLLRKEQRTILSAAVDSLPSTYREVIVLHYVESSTLSEIANRLSITEGNVKIRLFRARQMLAIRLRSTEKDGP